MKLTNSNSLMKFTNSKSFWFIGSVGLVLLTSPVAIAGTVSSSQSGIKQKLGGIPVACYIQQINQMPDRDAQRHRLWRVFNRYESRQQDDLTLQLANAVEPKQFLEPKLEAILWVIRNALKAGDQAKAVSLLAQASKLVPEMDNTTTKAQLLNQIGLQFMATGQPDQAEAALTQSIQVYERAAGVFVAENVEFRTNIAGWYTAIGKPEQAIALLNQTAQKLRSLPDKDVLPFHNKVAMLARISVQYMAAGQPATANQLFAQSLDLATAPQDPLEIERQLSIVLQVTSEPIPADELARLPVGQRTSLLANYQEKRNQVIGRLLHVFKSLKLTDRDRKVVAWSLADMWVSTHQVEQAVQFANTLDNPVEKFAALAMIMDGYKSKDADRVIPLLAEADQTARLIQNVDIRTHALIRVAATYAKFGQQQQAFRVLEGIQDPVTKQAALAEIAGSIVEAGHPDQALALVQTLPATLPPQTTEIVLIKIVQAYAKSGQFGQALQVTHRITQREIKEFALNAIGLELAKAGNMKQAIAILRSITSPALSSILLNALIDQALSNGKLDQAWEFAQGLPMGYERNYSMDEIATAYAEAGQYAKALQVAQVVPDKSLAQLLTCAQSTSVTKPATTAPPASP